jgi:hypothetical protein
MAELAATRQEYKHRYNSAVNSAFALFYLCRKLGISSVFLRVMSVYEINEYVARNYRSRS